MFSWGNKIIIMSNQNMTALFKHDDRRKRRKYNTNIHKAMIITD